MRAVFGRTWRVLICAGLLALGVVSPAIAQMRPGIESQIAPAEPDAALAARLFASETPVSVTREDFDVPGWKATDSDGTVLGYIGSSWEIARSIGYSGRPIDILVAVSPSATIVASQLMQHSEPILTLGLSDDDITHFVGGFSGVDLSRPLESARLAEKGQPDIISRATVSTGVIRDSILRVGRTLALSRGLLSGGRIDRLGYEPADWSALGAMQAIASVQVSMAEAAKIFADADTPPKPGAGVFIDLSVALLDPPTIGRNILGQQAYTSAVGGLPAGKVALFVASYGLQSHRGVKWRRSGVFDRIAVVQNGQRFDLTDQGYTRIDKLPKNGAPAFKERSIFHLGGDGFDPAAPFQVEVTATRAGPDGPLTLVAAAEYTLPDRFLRPVPPPPTPLWQETWGRKRWAVGGVIAMLTVLTTILFAQEALVKRPALYQRLRFGFLAVTLIWLGGVANAQLSVVQVVAFLQSLLTGFQWETFLIEPLIFVLWGFVALGLLFWGRGVFCGWLCPFGALQELLNAAAKRLGVRQIAVPHALHERLWVIKYTLFIAILALSFYSMKDALILAEAEPFKTVFSLRMVRAWPFVLFVLVLLGAGLFIERFYCRYLCPLGAALGIPAKLKIFDWLRRRPQCGRECRLCEPKCTVGAIDPLGRINPNECVLCLRCQVIFHDVKTCPTLMRRARSAKADKA